MATDLIAREPAAAYQTYKSPGIEINQLHFHKLDIKQEAVSEIRFKEADIDFVLYINEVLAEVVENKKGRRFRFVSDNAEMHTLLTRSVYDGKFHKSVGRPALLQHHAGLKKEHARFAVIPVVKGISDKALMNNYNQVKRTLKRSK